MTIENNSLLHPRTEAGEDNLKDQFKLWLWDIKAEPVFTSEPNFLCIRLHELSKGARKLLFLIEYILTAKKGELLILENPESNLHPSTQTKIGFLLSKAVQSGIKVVVETHSDHILNSIRVAARRNWIDPEKVKINFLHHSKEGIEVINPILDQNGRLDKWPRGFFDEWDNMINELL